jgi:hypothetical protein
MTNEKALREHVVKLLRGGDAHATFEQAVKEFPVEARGRKPKGLEHSAWELLEHLRIALEDLVDFSVNPKYKVMQWPEEYWPASAAPPDAKAWDGAVKGYEKALQAMCDLVMDEGRDLFARIPHGEGQTILREALVAADHNAYHLGQIVQLRKVLGVWKG